MKYIYKKTSLEVNNWPKDGGEYFNILGFVHQMFKDNGKLIPVDVPTPVVKFTEFHYNTKSFTKDVENETVIYIPSNYVGKQLHATLITSLVMYYGKMTNDDETPSLILDEIEVRLTLAETAITSGLVVGGVLITKSILNRIF